MNTVLGWGGLIVGLIVVYVVIIQLSRPDDDWKGWDDPRVPYKAPRWGVQPRPLLKLIVAGAAMFLLADWMKNDDASVVSVWLKDALSPRQNY
jgi:hypothetical protein